MDYCVAKCFEVTSFAIPTLLSIAHAVILAVVVDVVEETFFVFKAVNLVSWLDCFWHLSLREILKKGVSFRLHP
ncbi:hypothetical protein [Vibrio phage vB_VpaS_CHI]|nr:hypothetical protein [Vibrio phage vB_VpaS_ALK]USL90157.1 hypothetical protein [Vibrio phage vB_VpaS_CHI]